MSTDREAMAEKARAKHQAKHAPKPEKGVGEQVKEAAGKAVEAVKGAAKKVKEAVVKPKAT
jgi:hypothetical protein